MSKYLVKEVDQGYYNLEAPLFEVGFYTDSDFWHTYSVHPDEPEAWEIARLLNSWEEEDYKKLYEQEKARKEWLLFNDLTEFPDGSSCCTRTHLKRDRKGAYLACIGTSSYPSGKLALGILATAPTADEAIDKAIEIMKKGRQ